LENTGDVLISDIETIVTKVVEDAAPAVVGIGIDINGELSEDSIVGSGFIITENGLIVTNQHVVSDGEASDYFVVLPEGEETVAVEEIYRDQLSDIAILKIDKETLPTIPLGDSDNLQVGQTVIAIGNPLGSLNGTVTTGIISGLNRDVEVGGGFFNSNLESYEDVIQTDAAVNPGNSGGPLINSQGEVIGVNFATIQDADNLSFALPINRVKQRVEELNEYGDFRIPFVGIEYRQRVFFYKSDTLIGAVIVDVLENGPADQAGLKKGDVIVQYDGKSLDENTLFNLIQKSEIAEEVEVVVFRDSEQMTLNLVIGERSDYN
jgi:S1-C subfamily serine protease